MLPLLFIMLPFLPLVIPMAFLFAVFLTFSRLSADGEYSALLASGYSLARASKPVLLVAAVLYVVGVFGSLHFEAWGRRELIQFYYRKTQTEIDNLVKFKMQPGVFLEDFLGFVFYAESVSENRSKLDNVILAPAKDHKGQDFLLMAPSGKISGSVEKGDFKIAFENGLFISGAANEKSSSVLKFQMSEVDLLRLFQERIFGTESSTDDYRSLPPLELFAYVEKLKADQNRDNSLFWKARYLLHQRFGTPFAVIGFAFFGMVLGIHDVRKGRSGAFAAALMTIMGGYLLLMSFKWLAEHGHISAPVGAWLPCIILMLVGGFLVFQKNRLPLSESPLDPKNIPIVSRFYFPDRERFHI